MQRGQDQVWNSKLEVGATFGASILGAVEPSCIACAGTCSPARSNWLQDLRSVQMDATDDEIFIRALDQRTICASCVVSPVMPTLILYV